MQITITKINRKQVTSQKTGRPFESVSLQAEEYGNRWLNGFGRKDNKSWKEGDKVEVEVTESTRTDTNGQPYLNFTMPELPKFGGVSNDPTLKEILETLKTISGQIGFYQTYLMGQKQPEKQEDKWVDLDAKDLPF